MSACLGPRKCSERDQRVQDFDAVTFDVYCTLIDWEPAIIAFLTDWASRHQIDLPGPPLLKAFDRARADIQQQRTSWSAWIARVHDCLPNGAGGRQI